MTKSRKWKLAVITRILTRVSAIFGEIFDESAYTRFLTRHGIASSRTAYAEFLREQEILKARRPKCC